MSDAACKHTPGPWNIESTDCIVSESGVQIADLLRAEDDWEANARLIASAPDLLDLCVSAETFIAELARRTRLGDVRKSANEWISAYQAAVAKATGEGGGS